MLLREIEARFPEYAALINPRPATVEEARTALRPGEALIATYVGRDRTLVWAVPRQGTIAFAAVDVGRVRLAETVAVLRAALDPNAATLGDIPTFDVSLALDLYQRLLKPVESGWKRATTILVVAHGPLGHLPLSLLPTAPTGSSPDKGLLFDRYRSVPWLARRHAVVVLPSVAALKTLRAQGPWRSGSKPFVGFGDPYFNAKQFALAKRNLASNAVALASRGRLHVRAAPDTARRDSARIAQLPRLPETAEEVRGIARALNADPATDVYLGERASEANVKGLDLSDTRVIVFATHELVPGDLDGLAQPALALAAPEVTGDKGDDGLLTMGEILELKLHADWIVLSACNTASGEGAGAETISGLGRAFFYAGSRALLVSNWPVESISAKVLTTELFRRQAANPKLSRAQALRQAMLFLIDEAAVRDARGRLLFSYAHPIFWSPFSLVGDGG